MVVAPLALLVATGATASASEAAAEMGVATDEGEGWRLISNAGENGVQEVPHLHVHILGGRRMGRMVQPPKD